MGTRLGSQRTRNLTGGANLQFGVRPGCTDDFEFVDVDFFTDDCDKGGSVIPVNVEIEPFFDYPDNEGDGFGIEDPLKLLTSRIPPGTPVMWPLRMVFAPANPLTVNVELTTSEIVDIPGEPTTRVVLLEGRPEDNGAEIGDFRTTNPIVIPVTLTGALTRDFTVKVFVGEVPLSAPTLLNPPDDAPTSGDTPPVPVECLRRRPRQLPVAGGEDGGHRHRPVRSGQGHRSSWHLRRDHNAHGGWRLPVESNSREDG